MGDCKLFEEEGDVIEEKISEVDEGGLKLLVSLDSSESNIATPGDRWWSATVKKEVHEICRRFQSDCCQKRTDSPDVEVSLSGVGSVLRPEREAWSIVKWPGY